MVADKMSNLTEWENEHGRDTGGSTTDTGARGGSLSTGSGVADSAEGTTKENGSEESGTPAFPSHFSAGLRIILTRMYECPEEFNDIVKGSRWQVLLENYSHTFTEEEKQALAHHRKEISRRDFDAAVMKELMKANEPKAKPKMSVSGGGGSGLSGGQAYAVPLDQLLGGQGLTAIQQAYQNQAMSAANNPSPAMYGSIYDRLRDRFERNIQSALHKGDYITAEHLQRQFNQEVAAAQSKEAQENQPGMLSRAVNFFR